MQSWITPSHAAATGSTQQSCEFCVSGRQAGHLSSPPHSSSSPSCPQALAAPAVQHTTLWPEPSSSRPDMTDLRPAQHNV
jgi:hypothetical protein